MTIRTVPLAGIDVDPARLVAGALQKRDVAHYPRCAFP